MSNQEKSEFCFQLQTVNADDELEVQKSIESFFENLKIEKPKLIIDFSVTLKSNQINKMGSWVL